MSDTLNLPKAEVLRRALAAQAAMVLQGVPLCSNSQPCLAPAMHANLAATAPTAAAAAASHAPE